MGNLLVILRMIAELRRVVRSLVGWFFSFAFIVLVFLMMFDFFLEKGVVDGFDLVISKGWMLLLFVLGFFIIFFFSFLNCSVKKSV